VSQNHRIIKLDACDPALARDVRRRPIQVATQARSREPVSPSSCLVVLLNKGLEGKRYSPSR
jgi:hypothetical protein